MSESRLGLTGAVSIALGGMVGGGIFAILGVVAGLTGPAAWLAFVAAGVVAACAGYAYVSLDRQTAESGGAVTFLERYVGNATLAGVVGWTLLVGYVGSMAMYAYAFGRFSESLVGVDSLGGIPIRPVVSVAAVATFVALNLAGARASGTTEVALVGGKVAILLALGLGGLGYAFTSPDASVSLGLSGLGGLAPLVAASLSFVPFQGWQLLLYDEDVIRNESTTVPRAIFLSIAGAVVVYVLVALVTTNLAAQAVEQHPETALAFAAKPLLGQTGVLPVEVAALFSTGSAINATLFSSARFAEGMLDDGLLPDEVGRAGSDGPSRRLVLALGGLTAAFTAAGSLDGITSFASLAFIAVFGVVSVLAVREREDTLTGVVVSVGLLGTATFFPLLCYHLVTDRPEVAWTVLVVAVVVGAELLYFERETLLEEAVAVERRL